jgi:hypothetical protein
MMSAEKTVLSTESSAVKSKRRAILEINPSRLQFEPAVSILSSSIRMDNESESMETESFEDGSEVELSGLRDVRGIRHLDEDGCDEMEGRVSVPDWQTWGNMVMDSNHTPPMDNEFLSAPCFTPTGCCVASWDQASSSTMSASPTPLLSRPVKKIHVAHDDSGHSIDTIAENESAIMDREDFTKLFREASSLDYQSHYEYGTMLGRGHFGEVWSVRHTRSVQKDIS